MKKILSLYILICFLFLSQLSIKAQDNIIKANILSPIVKTGSFFYERSISKKSALQLGLFVTAFEINGYIVGEEEKKSQTKWSGFGITPEYRYHFSANKLKGFYLAVFFRFQKLSVSYKDYDEFYNSKSRLTTFGGGLLIGYQWVIKEQLSVGSFIGPRYYFDNWKIESGNVILTNTSYSNQEFYTGLGIRLGITVGIGF